MAKIPSYPSPGGRITTDAPAVDISPKALGQRGEEITAIGDSLSSLADVFSERQAKTESSRATIEKIKRWDALHAQAMTDPDIEGRIKALPGQLQEIIKDTSTMIFNPEARQNYINSQGPSLELKGSTIETHLRQRQLNEGRAQDLKQAEQYQQEYNEAPNATLRDVAKAELTHHIEDSVRRGFMEPTQATTYLQKLHEDLPKGRARTMMVNDPKGTYQELQKGKDGEYADLSPADRVTLMNEAEKETEKQNVTGTLIRSISQNHFESALLDEFYAGNVTPTKVAEALTQGKITASFADKLLQANESPKTRSGNLTPAQIKSGRRPTSDAKTYIDLTDASLKPDANPSDLRQRILTALADGQITPTDAKYLYTVHHTPTAQGAKASLAELLGKQGMEDTQKLLEQEAQDQKKLREKKSWLQAAWEAITHHTDHPEQQASMHQDLMKQISTQQPKDEQIPTLAHKLIADDVAKKFPGIETWPKTGKIIYTPKSRKYYRFYPDKTYQEISEDEAKAHARP